MILERSRSKTTYKTVDIHKNRNAFDRNVSRLFPQAGFSKLQQTKIAGVNATWFISPTKTNRTIIYIHGGGFVFGSLKTHAQHTTRIAKICKANLLAVDYSLAPESPYPVALNEIQKVWDELIINGLDTTKAVIIGDSAGGNLAFALSLKLRELKNTQPACLVLLSPALDAYLSGKSYHEKEKNDPLLTMGQMEYFMKSYVGKASRDDPLISPVLANLKNLPPILIQVGTEEILLSDSETISKNAKRDGADVTLDVGQGMWHGWQLFAAYIPEAKNALKAIASYIDEHTA